MNLEKKLLLATIAFAAIFRLGWLNLYAPSLFGDEIDVGYHAWSLVTTGRDYMGNLLPTYIRSVSEYRAPLLMYLVAPFVAILGPNDFSVRIPAALMGILSIYLLYLWTNKLYPKKTLRFFGKEVSLGLLVALVSAFSPWHVHYSRAAFEVTLLISLLLLGSLMMLEWIENSSARSRFFPFPLILSFYTYSTATLFVPLLVVCHVIHKPKAFLSRKLFGSYFVGMLLFIPIFYQLAWGPAANRFKQISVFSDQILIDEVINKRNEGLIDQKVDRFFNNKITAYSNKIASNYLMAYSPQFLFLDGDYQPRHHVKGFGEYFIFLAPLFFFGLAWAINSRERFSYILLWWLALAAIPSALTADGAYHATRLFILFPATAVVIGGGLFWLCKCFEKYAGLVLTLFVLISAVFFCSFWYDYTSHYRNNNARVWGYGYEQIFSNLPDLKGHKIYINNTHEPSLVRFAFFSRLKPSEFQKLFTGDIPSDLGNGFSGFKLGENIFFGRINSSNSGDIARLLNPGDFYMAVQGVEVPGDWDWRKSRPKGLDLVSCQTDIWGQPLFYLVTRNNEAI